MNFARVCRKLRNGDLHENIVCGANGERVEVVIYTTVTINKVLPLCLRPDVNVSVGLMFRLNLAMSVLGSTPRRLAAHNRFPTSFE